jgi:hypothetical protein
MVYFDDFSGNDFSDKVASELFIKIRALLSSGKTVNFSSLSAGFDQKKIGEISRILNLNANVDVSKSEFLKYFNIFKQRKEINSFKLSKDLEYNKILKFLDKLKKSKV